MRTPPDVGLKYVKRHKIKVFLCACVLDPLASYSFSHMMQNAVQGHPACLSWGPLPTATTTVMIIDLVEAQTASSPAARSS